MSPQQLAALLQLSSPALPIGGFSYSQGFEAAVTNQLITDEASAQTWIHDILLGVFAQCEAPIWILLYQAWQAHDDDTIRHWNRWYWASRESHELRLETEQMGWSLMKLARALQWGNDEGLDKLQALKPLTLPCAHSYAAHQLALPLEDSLIAYGFAWCENQVMAAMKTIPLGQVAGQTILQNAQRNLPQMLALAQQRASQTPPQLNTFSHQLGMLSAKHETQYSRLFRS